MKTLFQKITCLVLFAAAMAFGNGASAQCAYNSDPYLTWDASTELVTVGDAVSSTCTYAGESNTVENMVAGNTYYINTCGNTAFDTELTIYYGGNPVEYNDDGACGLQSEIYFTPTVSGDYIIQINELGCFTNSVCMDMVIELTAVAGGGSAPVNDDCAGAIALTPGDGECNPVTGSVANATASPNAGCGTGTPDDDVWYKFTATSDTVVLNVLGGTGFDPVVEAFVGTSCNSLVSIGCLDNTLDGELESILVSQLTIGATYWIRVYDYFSGTPAGTDFTICLYNPCSVSAPNNAIAETEACLADENGGCNSSPEAYQDITCGQTVKGTLWADGGNRDLDWFRFTVTTTTTATWTGAAEMPFGIGFIDVDDCLNSVIVSNGGLLLGGSACTPTSVSTVLTPGTYAAVIAVFDFDYYVCSNDYSDYWATLTMTTTNPTVTPGGNTTFCQGGSVTLNSSAGSSYLWSPGGSTNQSVTASASGSYTVTVPDPNGCGPLTSAPVTVTVNQPPSTPTITPGGSLTFCTGGSVTLTSSSGSTYLWSPGGATSQQINATTAGTYTVTVGNANGCTATSAPVTVTVGSAPSTPTITPGGSTTFCQGGSVTLTSSSGTAYLWSPGGATTQAINATSGGTYTVTVGTTGCTATSAPLTVTVNPAPSTPVISAGGTTTFCQGGSVTLTSTSGSEYLWSPGGATTQSITAGTGGSYTVTVGPNGCSSTSAATVVTVNATPTAAYSFSQNDPTVSFTGAPTGGTPTYTYDWDFDDGSAHDNTQSPSRTYNSTGSFDVVFCVTDANTCTNCVTHTVTITTVGIDDNSVVNSLNIYPNPAKDMLNIFFNLAETNNVEVKLMNSTGQLVFSEKLEQFSGSYSKQLNISAYATGNYMLQIVSEAGVINRKIVVK